MRLRLSYLILAAACLLPQTLRAQMGNTASGGDDISGSYTNFLTVDFPYRLAGEVLIIGEGEDLRAMLPYGGSADNGAAFAEVVNRYADAFPQVHIWCMPIPSACEFYTPYAAESLVRSQERVIRNLFLQLSPAVARVDIHPVLAGHVAEPVFARTDHRWLPLGAFYAAEQFSADAEVPFRDLDAYAKRTVTGYLGTLYRFCKDEALAGAPETFVRYTPKDREALHPKGRKLLIIKDGAGKMLSDFLQYGFEEVQVLDARRFSGDVSRIVSNRGITDILFALDLEHIGMKPVLENLSLRLGVDPLRIFDKE